MKTTLLKSALLVASLMGALSSASAETLHVNIPFGFTAGGIVMPPGSYSIRPLPSAPTVLLFENETTKMQAIVFARASTDAPSRPVTPLTFTSDTGEGAELANIAAAGWTYELSVHPVTRPLKGAALAITSSSK